MEVDYEHVPASATVADRFRQHLKLLRECHPTLNVSQLADTLGYRNGRFLESLYAGDEYHDWDEIEDFCHRARISASWLKHGYGTPFAPNDACSNREHLLVNELKARHDWYLYFVRSQCDTGNVAFVVRENDYVWEVYSTLIHLSGKNGVGGGQRLVTLYDLIVNVRNRWEQRVLGYTLPRAEFNALQSGEVFPEQILRHQVFSSWWDDFTLLDLSCPTTRERLAGHGDEFLDAQSFVRWNLDPENMSAPM